MSIPAINYRETFFPNPDLTRIIGIPTYETLRTLNIELKTNAQSVHSNLGGGHLGHLGLILTATQYALISPLPYVRPPVHPGVLTILPGTARIPAETAARAHTEALRVFYEVRGVEQALIQQIIAAVDQQYLISLRNRTTGQFTGNVLQILQYLHQTYGRISPGQLGDFESEVVSMTYDPCTPVDNVFNKVEDMMEYGELAQLDYTERQAVAKAYNILLKTGKFGESIRAWTRLPQDPSARNWINFKDHFRSAHLELTETGELTLQEVGYGQANLVEDIVSRLSAQFQYQANLVAGEAPPPAPAPAPAANQAEPCAPPPPDYLREVLAQNADLMRRLMENTNNGLGTRIPRRGRPSDGPRTGQPSTPLPAHFNKYCWTHGRCNHLGSACNNKAPGHKDTATIANKLGGSCYACPDN